MSNVKSQSSDSNNSEVDLAIAQMCGTTKTFRQQTLFENILAAKFFDFKRLSEASSKIIANMIKGSNQQGIFDQDMRKDNIPF